MTQRHYASATAINGLKRLTGHRVALDLQCVKNAELQTKIKMRSVWTYTCYNTHEP